MERKYFYAIPFVFLFFNTTLSCMHSNQDIYPKTNKIFVSGNMCIQTTQKKLLGLMDFRHDFVMYEGASITEISFIDKSGVELMIKIERFTVAKEPGLDYSNSDTDSCNSDTDSCDTASSCSEEDFDDCCFFALVSLHRIRKQKEPKMIKHLGHFEGALDKSAKLKEKECVELIVRTILEATKKEF